MYEYVMWAAKSTLKPTLMAMVIMEVALHLMFKKSIKINKNRISNNFVKNHSKLTPQKGMAPMVPKPMDRMLRPTTTEQKGRGMTRREMSAITATEMYKSCMVWGQMICNGIVRRDKGYSNYEIKP
jgi:hypothetical protein